MGIENTIRDLPEKQLGLFKNLISIGVILTIVYAVFSIAGLDSPMQFFNHGSFLTVAISLIMLSFAWKFLEGGRIVVPNGPNTPQQGQNKIYSQPKQDVYCGSWKCSRCGIFVIGGQCPKCGRRR